jgi:hypothetical protein
MWVCRFKKSAGGRNNSPRRARIAFVHPAFAVDILNEAAVAQAHVQVKGDEVKIKELKRYAPFSGIMSRSTVAEGAHLIRMAGENTGMAKITELDPIQVKAWFPFEVYVA